MSTQNNTQHTIASWNLSITWSDGKKEGLVSHLPEYLVEELSIYFQELEEHRAEVEEDYNFEDEESEEA